MERAERRLEVAIRRDPPLVAAHRAHQDLLTSRGLGHVVFERYRGEARDRPDRAASWYLLGRLIGDDGEQEKAFRRTIRLDPGLSWGHHGLGAVLRRAGDLDGAVRSYRRATALAPAEATHWLGLAGAERDRGAAAAAERAARLALWADPGEPATWGVLADLGERRGDGPGSIAATREALARSGGAAAWRRALGRRVRAFGSEVTIRAALQAEVGRLAEAPEDRTAWVEVGLHRLRLGDLDGGSAALEEGLKRGADPHRAILPWRRALVRGGRFLEAIRVDGLVVPSRLRQGEGNVLSRRWERLRAAAAQAESTGGHAAVALGEAMIEVGWLEEAASVLRGALVRDPEDDRARRALGRAAAFREITGRLVVALERGYRGRGGPGTNLDTLLSRAGDWMRRAGIEGSPERAERISYLLVGEVVDGLEPGRSALHDRLLEAGHLLVLGQQSGATVEALLGEGVSLERERRSRVLGRELTHARLVVAHLEVGSRRGASGDGDPSGLAMEGFDLLNLDAIGIRPYRAGMTTEIPPWRPVDPADRRSVDWPGDVLRRLATRLPAQTRDLRLDVVARHEQGHLLDAERYLPVHAHPLRGLGLVVGAGFSIREVQGRLEGNAQLVALAAAREPRAALYELIAVGTRRGGAPPHSLGYHDALRELIDEIADEPDRYPAIEPEANILQQLDRLEPDEVRALARRLLARRGLP